MKKFIVIWLLCGGTLGLQAYPGVMMDETKKASQEEKTDRHTNVDPVYIQLFGGINKSANENLPFSEFSSYPLSMGFFVGVGKEFTPLWGWRIAFRYNHNKSRNVEKCESQDTWGWSNLGLFGDLTFDLTDALSSKPHHPKTTNRTTESKGNPFNLKAFLGVGAAYTFGFDEVPLSYTEPYSRDSRLLPAARIGLTATYRVANHWRVGAELSQTAFADVFNGVKANVPLDTRTNLKVGISYLFGKDKKVITPQEPIVMSNRLRAIPALPFRMPEPENIKKRSVAGCAFLDFPVNETVIYPQYRRNPQELRRICATIDSALFDKTIQVTHISLHGYASPESPYSNNTRLAKGRTASLMEYLRKRYHLSASMFYTQFTPEDWDNLRSFIADGNRRRVKGDIWYENANILETPEIPMEVTKYRNELLEVIDQNIDLDEKEQKLKQVGGGIPYKWLLQHVYPGLRHTDYVVEYVVRSYPVNKSRKLIYTHPEALSLQEMYMVAQSYEKGTDDWLDALMIAAKQYPGDTTANLNAACACVEMKRLSDAKRFLANAGDSQQALYLADIIKAMEGKCQWKMENGKVVIVK